jgi:CDP-paratose 2-epimerase
VEEIAKVKIKRINVKQNRVGDHIWYISDLSKFKKHYPNWKQKFNTRKIIEELIDKTK